MGQAGPDPLVACNSSAAAAAAVAAAGDYALLVAPETVCRSLVAEQAGLSPQSACS